MEKRRLLADALTSLEGLEDLTLCQVFRAGNYASFTVHLKDCYERARVLGAYFHNTFPTQSALYTSVIDWIIPTQDRFCVHTHPLQECFCYLPVVCKVTIKSRKAFGRCCYYEQVRVCLF